MDFAGILERTGFLPPSLPLQPKEDTLISSGGSSVALVSPEGRRSAYTFVQVCLAQIRIHEYCYTS